MFKPASQRAFFCPGCLPIRRFNLSAHLHPNLVIFCSLCRKLRYSAGQQKHVGFPV